MATEAGIRTARPFALFHADELTEMGAVDGEKHAIYRLLPNAKS
jgi:hypothetical protein